MFLTAANLPFAATENCAPWWLAVAGRGFANVAKPTLSERGADARIGDVEVAEGPS